MDFSRSRPWRDRLTSCWISTVICAASNASPARDRVVSLWQWAFWTHCYLFTFTAGFWSCLRMNWVSISSRVPTFVLNFFSPTGKSLFKFPGFPSPVETLTDALRKGDRLKQVPLAWRKYDHSFHTWFMPDGEGGPDWTGVRPEGQQGLPQEQQQWERETHTQCAEAT